MKKRILAALLATMLCIVSTGVAGVSAETGDLILSDTTAVNVENTDTCFAKPTNSEYHVESNYYMHFKTEGDWLEVTQNLTEAATAGSQYVFTVVAKPVSGTAWFRVGWDDTGWLTSGQIELATDLGNGWFKYVKEITMTGDQTNVLFHNDGATEIYVDSISLKPVDEEKELLPNGGFNSVVYDSANDVITVNTTTINVPNTETYFVDVIRESFDTENEYSLHFKASADDWLEVSQNLTDTAKAGGKYVLTAYVKPVTGTAWFYIDWDATGWMATHAADVIAPQPDGWTMIQKTITMTEDKAKLLFHNDGETEMYIDDISLVSVDGTENLIPDGGFDEVTVVGGSEEPEEPTVDIPDENLTLSGTTHVNMENTDACFAKVTDNEKASRSYSLHFKAGASDWLEVDQTLTEGVTAGNKYILSASVKVVTGKVWFRVDWDDTGWLVSNQTELGTDIGNGWVKLVKEITLTGDQTKLLFHNDGEAEMYIDDISLKAVGSETELVPDGGFEEVTIEGGGGGAGGGGIPHDHTFTWIDNGDGTHKGVCVCGLQNIEPHIWEGSITTPPTTETEGLITYTCLKCGANKIEIIEKLEPTVDIPDENLTLSGTTHVNMDNTETCFAKVTDNEKASGSYSLHFKATGTDWLEVDQTLTEGVTAGNKYILSASVKVVTGKVWFRVDWDDTGWLVSNQTDLGTDIGNGWVKLVKEITLTGDQAKLLFHNDGEAEMYIDDISLKAVGSDVELVPDGGFEEVTVNTPAEDIPDENLILSSTTTTNAANTETCFAKVTDNEKNSGSYSLHFKATADDWFEVYQNLTETATSGGQYVFTAYIKPVTGKVWFRIDWDDTGWMVSSQEGTVQSNGWTKIQKTITLAADQTKLLFHNDGETEMYIDDISLVPVGGTTELIPDGGFEEVTIVEPKEDIPDEKLVLSDKTTVNVENTETTFAKVTDDEQNAGEYSLHFKAAGSDWLEVSQRLAEPVVAGGTYIISADVKVASGQVWFRLGWDDDGWLMATVPMVRSAVPTDWTHVEKEVTLAGTANGEPWDEINTVLFHNSGETEAYIDNLSVKAVGSDTELVPDGGFEDVIVACDEHAYDEGVETQAPTCKEEGIKTLTCTVCGLTKTESIPTTDEHIWDEGVVTLEPTVDAEGVKTYTCTVCGETYTEAIEKLPVPSVSIGDANEDGEVDVGDVTFMRQDIAGGYGVEVNETVADVNKDGAFDVGDVTYLRQWIAGGYGIVLQ